MSIMLQMIEPVAGLASTDVVVAAPHTPIRERAGLRLYVLGLLLALLGGGLGILGSIVQELQSIDLGLFVVFVGAPVIEEMLKPAGIYILLAKWPLALRNQLHTALLCAISGLTFGLIESYVYVTYYYPEGDSDYDTFRYTVPVAMHAAASFIVGLGLSQRLVEWARKGGSLPKTSKYAFFGGIGLHALYNTSVTILAVAGVLTFD